MRDNNHMLTSHVYTYNGLLNGIVDVYVDVAEKQPPFVGQKILFGSTMGVPHRTVSLYGDDV